MRERDGDAVDLNKLVARAVGGELPSQVLILRLGRALLDEDPAVGGKAVHLIHFEQHQLIRTSTADLPDTRPVICWAVGSGFEPRQRTLLTSALGPLAGC